MGIRIYEMNFYCWDFFLEIAEILTIFAARYMPPYFIFIFETVPNAP